MSYSRIGVSKMELHEFVTLASKILWLEENIKWTEDTVTHLRCLKLKWLNELDELKEKHRKG